MPATGKMAPVIPEKQRALVLQGAAGLGAYEAGVFKTLYDELNANPLDANNNNVFDIIAGTSAGAINAAILVSCVRRNRNWDDTVKVLLEYWNNQWAVQTPPYDSLGTPWYFAYQEWHAASLARVPGAASQEAARRYFSTKYFFANGVDTVYGPPYLRLDNRFYDNNGFDPTNNLWYHYDNQPLADGLASDDSQGNPFIKFPLSTDYNNGEPRLITVATDVQYGKGVVFDSYFNDFTFNYTDPKTCKQQPLTVKYPNGIELDHIMAGASLPLFYDYREVSGRKFWDGGVLSNTPLRELIQAHRRYWLPKAGPGNIPRLEVYIVDVWPAEVPEVPTDHDALKDRFDDILACDKTEYDQRASFIVSDLIKLTKSLIPLALANDPTAVAGILGQLASIKGRDGIRRTLQDLVGGGVVIDKVVTIQRALL